MGRASPRCRSRRRRTRRDGGATLVEFALVAPFGFLLILGIVLSGIVVTNYIQLTNAARDGARLAAICGQHTDTNPDLTVPIPATTTLMPDGSGYCTTANIQSYIAHHLVSVPLTTAPTIFVCLPDTGGQSACKSATPGAGDLSTCQVDKIVEVDMTYDQPLYLPLISNLLQTKPNGTRQIQASAQATCEQ